MGGGHIFGGERIFERLQYYIKVSSGMLVVTTVESESSCTFSENYTATTDKVINSDTREHKRGCNLPPM